MSLFGDISGYISAGRAASAIGNANIAAEHGVLGAGQAAVGGVQTAVGQGQANVNAAGAGVTSAADRANSTLSGYLGDVQGTLAPSIASGAQGNQMLQDYAAKNPQFNFNLNDYLNSPAMKFQMEQGTNAITNNASAQGLGASGNTLKALDQYGQGLASTYYNQAFNQAQSQFQTNQNTTLANAQALINSGTQGNALNLDATKSFGGQQASNLVHAGDVNAGLQEYLASLGLQGATTAGQFSTGAAKTAGDFAVGAGNARAAGIMGQGAALSNGVADLGSMLMPGAGIIPG